MNNPFLRFLGLNFLLGAVFLVAHLLLFKQTGRVFHDSYYLLHLYFFLLTALVHYFLLKGSGQRPQLFISWFMGATTFKMLVSLGILLIYNYFNRDTMIPFSVTFLILYFGYTILEIIVILKELKKD